MRAELPKREPDRVRLVGASAARTASASPTTRPGRRRRSSCTTARRTPTASCTWGTSSTACSRTRWSRSTCSTARYADFVPGWDMHGLPIERETLKHLGPATSHHEIDPLELRAKCRERALYVARHPARHDAADGRLRPLRRSVHDDRAGVRGDDRRDAGRSRRGRPDSTRACARRCGASTTRRRWPKPRSSTRTRPRSRSTSASPARPRSARRS